MLGNPIELEVHVANDRATLEPANGRGKPGSERSRPAAPRSGPASNPILDVPTHVTIKLSAKELELLIGLAGDQLFRREFIDPKLPGHRPNPAELSMAKEIVSRLRSMTERGLRTPGPKSNRNGK